MSQPASGRKFDSLDFFLVVMGLLTVVALFFLFHSWGKASELEVAVDRGPDMLDKIRSLPSRPANAQERRGLPTESYFNSELPRRGQSAPNSLRPSDPSSFGEGWTQHRWVVTWNAIGRRELASYIREAEGLWPGLRAGGIELRQPEPKDPQRDQWKATVTFTFYAPEDEKK